jgi:predicted nucleic acid-binding protein
MLIAADTNVLLDLALGTEAVMDALETLTERIPGVRLVVPPTVLHELALAVKSGETEKKRKTAFLALSRLREWGFEPLNLVPVGHGIVEHIAVTLRNDGLIPTAEMNDSLIVAESALLGCGILLSTDGHMREIDFQRLKLLLQDSHVAAPIIATPREIVKKFCR